MKQEEEKAAGTSVSLDSVIKSGKVMDMRFGEGGDVTVTVKLSTSGMKGEALRRTLTALTGQLM